MPVTDPIRHASASAGGLPRQGYVTEAFGLAQCSYRNSTVMTSARMAVLKANESSLWGSITCRKRLVAATSVVPKVIPVEYAESRQSGASLPPKLGPPYSR